MYLYMYVTLLLLIITFIHACNVTPVNYYILHLLNCMTLRIFECLVANTIFAFVFKIEKLSISRVLQLYSATKPVINISTHLEEIVNVKYKKKIKRLSLHNSK